MSPPHEIVLRIIDRKKKEKNTGKVSYPNSPFYRFIHLAQFDEFLHFQYTWKRRSQRADWKWNEGISSNNLKPILVVVIFVMNVSRVMPMLDFDFVIGFICNTNLNVPWYLIVPWEMWLWFRISNFETQLGIDILNISVELSWSENHLIVYW